MSKIKVAVLMGGSSAERPISLWTGKQILDALDVEKYTVFGLDTAGSVDTPKSDDVGPAMTWDVGGEKRPVASLSQLGMVDIETRPDVVIIALHGPGGEDGTVQGLLETLRLPYTGSGVLASALAMDKAMTKHVLRSGGVRMPADVTLSEAEWTLRGAEFTCRIEQMGLPVVVKPNTQGSTIGMTIVRKISEFRAAVDKAFKLDQVVIVEQFVEGVEITVPILGNAELEILPIVEIVPKSGFYDYEAKYTVGATEEICPARIAPESTVEAQRLSELSHKLLRCRGMSRTDMIVDKEGRPWVLEVNTIPGMTPLSLLPFSAKTAGYTFSALLDRLIDLALER